MHVMRVMCVCDLCARSLPQRDGVLVIGAGGREGRAALRRGCNQPGRQFRLDLPSRILQVPCLRRGSRILVGSSGAHALLGQRALPAALRRRVRTRDL